MIRRTAIVMLALALLTVGGAGAAPDFEDLQGKLVPIFSGPLGDPIAGRSYLPSIGCTESSRARASRSCW